MHEKRDEMSHAEAQTISPQSSGMDWRVLSDQRLDRLVDLEHDCFLMRERLAALQMDYRELFAVSEGRQQRTRELERAMAVLDDRLHALAYERDVMRASFLGSRSWRITRPLRAVRHWRSWIPHAASRVARAVLEVPVLRRVAGLIARRFPWLHQRIRAKLYSRHGGG
ncbi:hypothetical protein AB7849_16865 [Rhodanobacter sp. 115]|uniref:hypothetical protein n=1 Tax=Rhodanobacter sp. FW021-MT20 TaxID=1162282 RepID=UPI0002D57C0C|nr:hypothetical protein [Rhodanobacter sp. 115]